MDSIKWRVRATAGLIHVCYGSLTCCLFPAAGPPTGVSAVQVDGTTTVMVSWTAPTAGATPTGYRIYYQAAGDSVVIPIDAGPTATEHLLVGLSAGTTYTIRMLTRSEHLPSSVTAPEMVSIGRHDSGRSQSASVCVIIFFLQFNPLPRPLSHHLWHSPRQVSGLSGKPILGWMALR